MNCNMNDEQDNGMSLFEAGKSAQATMNDVHTISITPKPATATSLEGFRILCTCGYDVSCSIECLSQEWAREHLQWAADKRKAKFEKRRKRA